MVLGDAPRLRGARRFQSVVGLGLLTAAIAAAIGCAGKSRSVCETSRGCSAQEGGTPGSDPVDDEPPRVVALHPADREVDVERDVRVTAELSEPIDEATVTSRSVTLTGPDGNVEGTLSAGGNVISFVPHGRLSLLRTYTFTLRDTLADLAGNTLVAAASAEFRVRDGRFSEARHPFGRTVSRSAVQLRRNRSGDAVLGMLRLPERDGVSAALYYADEDRWTPATDLTDGTLNSMGIDSERRAVAALTLADAGFGWSRFTDQEEWVDAGMLRAFPSVVVSGSGLATALSRDDVALNLVTTRLELSTGSVEPAEPLAIYEPRLGPLLVGSLERAAAFYVRDGTSSPELVVTWNEGSSWSSPVALASAPDIGSLSGNSDEQGNIIVVWRQEEEIWSCFYDRTADTWTRAEFVTTATMNTSVDRPEVTAGNAIVALANAGAAVVYRAGLGWLENSLTGLGDSGDQAVAVDPAGNALAVWHSELRFRRYLAGVGWQPPGSLHANVDADFLLAAGAPDGSVLLVATDLGGSAGGVPVTFRFE